MRNMFLRRYLNWTKRRIIDLNSNSEYNKIMLSLIRRVMPTVIAHQIIGVQPLNNLVSQIHTLRTRYK